MHRLILEGFYGPNCLNIFSGIVIDMFHAISGIVRNLPWKLYTPGNSADVSPLQAVPLWFVA